MAIKYKEVLLLLTCTASLGGCGGRGSDAPPPARTVSGAVTGLAGSGLVLSLNGGADVAVGANGSFTFPGGLASGTAYTVSVRTQPVVPSQTCVVTNATGTIGSGPVADVSVACTTNRYTVRGTVSGLVGSPIELRLSGSPSLVIDVDGDFEFATQRLSGTSYTVTVVRQPQDPFQTCDSANLSGVIGASDTDILVTCTVDMFSVGGTVTGLTGLGLRLQLNGEQDLPIMGDGTFAFPDRLLAGTPYEVTIASQTSTYREQCGLENTNGTGGARDITNVTVKCGVVGGFAYAAGASFNGEIIKYGIHPITKALLPLGVAAVMDQYARRLVVAPNHATLYAIDIVGASVHAFSIDPSNGNLNAIGQPVATGVDTRPDQAVIDPSGRFFYVFNISSGTIALLSIDPATGALRFEREVGISNASAGTSAYGIGEEHLVMSPNGSHLYVLNHAYPDPTPPSLTTYTIDSNTGDLAEVATIDAGNAKGIIMDPQGRFLYLREVSGGWVVTVTPYSFDPATGAATSNNVTTAVAYSSGAAMVVDPSGSYAFILSSHTDPYLNRIDAFTIDPSSGVLTANGPSPLTPSRAYVMAVHSEGAFVFAPTNRLAGTDESNVWCGASTFPMSAEDQTKGQLLEPGSGCGIPSTFAFAVVD